MRFHCASREPPRDGARSSVIGQIWYKIIVYVVTVIHAHLHNGDNIRCNIKNKYNKSQ